jgi:hypothetical protein
MPYLITCDHCGTGLRTRTRRAVGDVIDCPKCGDRFEVRADNQRKEAGGEGPAAKKAARQVESDEDEDRPRRRRRRDEDEDYDDRPRRTKRGRLYLCIGLGVTGALLVGVGLFFLLRGSGSGPPPEAAKALKNRPKRDLPKDLFAYWPGEQFQIHYTDYTAGGNPPSPSVGPVTRQLGVTGDHVVRSLSMNDQGGGTVTVSVYELRGSFDLRAATARGKWDAIPVGGGTVYRSGGSDNRTQVIQPKPNVLIILGYTMYADRDTALAADLLRLGSDNRIPPEMWDAMKEVSGYPQIHAAAGLPGDPMLGKHNKYMATGRGWELDQEYFTCYVHANAALAKEIERVHHQIMDAMAKTMPEQRDRLRGYHVWRTDNRIYVLAKSEPNQPSR